MINDFVKASILAKLNLEVRINSKLWGLLKPFQRCEDLGRIRSLADLRND